MKYARAIELGRVVGRDIGGSDPERMAPPRVAEYVQNLFQQTSDIKVRRKRRKIFADFIEINFRLVLSKILVKLKKIFHCLQLLIELQVVCHDEIMFNLK